MRLHLQRRDPMIEGIAAEGRGMAEARSKRQSVGDRRMIEGRPVEDVLRQQILG